jgi:hypothetical protein
MLKPNQLTTVFCFCIFSLFSSLGYAHARYILPSHTILSGQAPQYVTLSASISNDIFHPDKPLGNNGGGVVNPFLQGIFQFIKPTITLPDGSLSDNILWQAYARQSVADLKLEQSGTYKISFIQSPTPLTTFTNAEGEKSRQFGEQVPMPSGATDIVRHTVHSRVETYITHNAPSEAALKASGQGLEVLPLTHPNDLFVGEPAQFQLLLNGKHLPQGIEVELTREGTRHRNQRGIQHLTTDPQGNVTVDFDQAGFYLLEVEYTEPGLPDSGIKFQHHSLYLTLEVSPE